MAVEGGGGRGRRRRTAYRPGRGRRCRCKRWFWSGSRCSSGRGCAVLSGNPYCDARVRRGEDADGICVYTRSEWIIDGGHSAGSRVNQRSSSCQAEAYLDSTETQGERPTCDNETQPQTETETGTETKSEDLVWNKSESTGYERGAKRQRRERESDREVVRLAGSFV